MRGATAKWHLQSQIILYKLSPFDHRKFTASIVYGCASVGQETVLHTHPFACYTYEIKKLGEH